MRAGAEIVDQASLERFQREAKAASALNHPGICTVHAIEQHDGQHFIAMELLEGETLAERVRKGALDLATLLDLGIQISDALESAHAIAKVMDLAPDEIPLEVAAKETDKKIRSRTIRHTDCIEVGHDKYDEVVTNFLNKIGEANIINITPINYTNLDIGTQKLMTEYGVFIIYRG